MPTHLPGRTLAPLTRGEVRALTNEPVFAEIPAWQMVRQGHDKLVTEGEEHHPTALYNLEEDPYEMTNLIEDPAQRLIIEALREQIIRWRRKCHTAVSRK